MSAASNIIESATNNIIKIISHTGKIGFIFCYVKIYWKDKVVYDIEEKIFRNKKNNYKKRENFADIFSVKFIFNLC